MNKTLLSLSPLALSSLLPLTVVSRFLSGTRGVHIFITLINHFFNVLHNPGHWFAFVRALFYHTRLRMLGVIPRGTGNVFKGRSHARITVIKDMVIPGHY